ncbi:TolC family protein [Pseudorhodoferax sp. Leaf267]|uniref:TolC family protein n=1 Tax=Pseudorhodoferax sp. Leaf267 TaxID=1736316 RepID=UPI0006F9CC33|nr:TolC family protein [Pseudorhodoferax sp. Leaf267]KQP22682.1 hypothetical protein ASF43_01875 [Pseudorhodoferax sp. Leaf267]
MRLPAPGRRTGRLHRAALPLVQALALAGLLAPAHAQQPLDPWGVMRLAAPADSLAASADPASAACAVQANAPAGTAAQPLTLERAVSLALCTSPRARTAWAGVAAQGAQLGQARAGLLPNLNMAASRTRDHQDTGNTPATTVQANGLNLTMNWLLFDFGARRASITQAEQNLQAALGSRDAALLDTVAEVAQAWYDAQTAAGALAATEVAGGTAAEILKAAEVRVAAGSAISLDAMRARNALAQAQLATARARSNEHIARAALARALGLDVRRPLVLSFEADDGAVPVPASTAAPAQELDTLVGQALASHPALRAARAQIAAAQARVDGASAERWPSLSLSYGNYRNGRPNTALTSSQSREQLVAVTLSIPLFDGFGRSYRIHEQLAGLRAREADAAAAESRIAFEVWRAYQTVQAETTAVAASGELVQGTQEAFAAARARHLAGAIDITEWLAAQREAAMARQEQVTALAAWRNARVRLLAMLGNAGFWATP